MGRTEHLLVLASLCQVVLLTCERHSNPIEVEIEFPPFPSSQDPDSFIVTCRAASNNLVYVGPIERSLCTPGCKLSFHVVEDSRSYKITLRARINDTTIDERTFDFIPISLNSLHMSSTTTSVSLTWSLTRQHNLSSLALYDIDNHSITGTFTINSSVVKSHYTVEDLQPGTRFKAKVVVSTFLKQASVTLKQRLSIGVQTAQCPSGWLANRRNCYSVRKKTLAWSDAQQSCSDLAARSQLADLKTREDLHFIASRLMSHNSLLLLWTGLNDKLEEGLPLWSDGSLDNMTNTGMSSLLPASHTDCYALQKNATGPGYFLTPFFCNIPLPFICQYHAPTEASLFPFDLVQVTEREVELRWSKLSTLNTHNPSPLEIFLQYQQEVQEELEKVGEQSNHDHGNIKKLVKVPIAFPSAGVTVAGLFPGSIYSFTLQATHPAGFKWSLGQTRTAHSRPFPPLNVTVGDVTVDQISVHWLLTDAHYILGWSFLVHYVDVALKEDKIAGMTNISRSSKTVRLHSYTAVIGGLESYRNYSIEVYTVTHYGIKSCGQTPLLVHTAVRAPSGLVAESLTKNLTVCWTTQLADPPDAYDITSHSLDNPGGTSTLIRHGSPKALWGNTSVCISLGTFTQGQTYNIGVVALKGHDRSQKTSILHTANPMAVPVAVPLTVGTTTVQLYIQHPQLGLIDGAKVCVCPKVCDHICEDLICGYLCDWYALHAGVHTVTISNLSPGSDIQMKVYSTSRNQTGPPYYTQQVRTNLAPPSRVREGVVTDSSIELLWDPAQGHAQSYEVICFNCEHPFMVQKVFSHSAVFSGLTPGELYHFAVQTEKQHFPDSFLVNINITAAPSMVELSVVNKSTSSICISWIVDRGVVSGFALSINSMSAKQVLISIHQEHRFHTFEGLTPGTKYTIEVTSISGERRSKPAVIVLHTIPGMPQDVTLSEQVVTSVFVAWRPPPGHEDGYKVHFGLCSVDRKFWIHVFVQSPSYEIKDLIPGSDYGLSIQSVLASDMGLAVHRLFSSRPAGLCGLHLEHINSSSVSISWDNALGDFDFHRITVANASVTDTITVHKEERVAVVVGLLDGCTYNVSAERVRGATAGRAASLTVTTVPSTVQEVRIINVSAHAFSLRWQAAVGCVDHYQVTLEPDEGKVIVHPAHNGYIQADVVSVSPGTEYSVTVSAAASSNISPGVSRMINTRVSVPATPFSLEGHTSGSNGILLSWVMPDTKYNAFIIRYREVCPYPATVFTEDTRTLDSPVVLLNDLISGSTYQFQVAAVSSAGVGSFSKSVYIKTAESPPGIVTNLTAFAPNHTNVVVTWFLPRHINGLITKFSVKVKHARTGMVIRRLDVNAEQIMSITLPHCNDAADILSRATVSPLEMTASSPPVTLSAVPPAALWKVPISVGVDKLQPYTPYLFEVSAFTSEGEGQTTSTMVFMPESAPEDSPQNVSILNRTSRFISVSWNPPNIVTGKFSYTLNLNGPTGFLLENNTTDTYFEFTDLKPYTKYLVSVRAKAAGKLGPAADKYLITPAEAPGAVQALMAHAEDSVSIRVSWKIPAQPNGPITKYRLRVLVEKSLLQDITLTTGLNESTTGLYDLETLTPDSPGRVKREADLNLITSPPSFTATISSRSDPGSTDSSSTQSYGQRTSELSALGFTPTVKPMATQRSFPTSAINSTDIPTSDTLGFATSAFSVTSAPPVTYPPWLTRQSKTDATSDTMTLTPRYLRSSTIDTSLAGLYSTATSSGNTGVTVKEEVFNVLSENMSYLVSDLNPFTEYMFRVTAFTTVGEGPASNITEKTREQVPSSVLAVAYQNISSTSILVSWVPPLNPNGRITHYTVYGFKVHNNQTLHWEANDTSILIRDLEKYTGYKLCVTASTAVGQSTISEEDFIFVFTSEDEPESPPTNLTVVDTSPLTVTLTWSPPDKANGVIQYYELLYENETYLALMNTSSNKVTLRNLKPFSYYNVSVKAYTRYGHGNQTSDTLYLLSGEDVPGSPPYGLTYESVSPSEVNVTWQPPELSNGVITHYGLELWNSTHNLNLTATANRIAVKHLKKYARYRIMVQAYTRVGPGNYSEPLNITTLEDVPSDSVHNLTAQNVTSQAIIVSWDPPLEPNGRLHYLLTLQEAAVPTNSSNQAPVTKNINVTTTDTLYLFTKLRIYFPYVLTVTPATVAGAAYNHTSTKPLRTGDDVPTSPPLLVSTRNLSSSSIAVVWQRPLEANGDITEYTLILSGPGGSNTTSTTNTSYVLTNLLQYTPYNFTVIAATRKGMGPPLVLHLHTDEGGPMSPPRYLTIYNHTDVSVWLSWEPALEPNGVVTHYGFRIQELITQTVTHQNSSGPSTKQYLSGFRPHSSYEISVCSYTRVGHGNQFSSPVTFTTNESVSDAVVNLSCSGVSWDSVRLSWERPDNPNGQILFYEIAVEVNSEKYIHQAQAAELTVTGLSPERKYTLTVVAVNSAGPGDLVDCTASTLSESVPAAPRFLGISDISPNNVTLQWAPPLSIPGLLKEYQIIAQLLSTVCEPLITTSREDEITLGCVDMNSTLSLNVANGKEDKHNVTIQSLSKYRYYRFKVAAVTNAGVGDYTQWIYERTLPGNPDAPPRNLRVTPTANTLHVEWDTPAVLSGPTSYLIQVEGPGVNYSTVQNSGMLKSLVVKNLTAFSSYNVTVIAFTGPVEFAAIDGKAIGPFKFQTLEEEPKSPPTNVTVSVIPETVNRVKVTFSPPEEPNGNITAYYVYIYQGEIMLMNVSLKTVQGEENMLSAVIDGLKGGHNYSIQISAKNGAGRSPPSPHVQITTGIKAPAKPTQRPQAMQGQTGVATVTHRSISIRMPACFYSDDNGPITKIQVIVAESGVKDAENVTNWKTAFFYRPVPYFTDKGFPNPACEREAVSNVDPNMRIGSQVQWGIRGSLLTNMTGVYMIGERDDCMNETDAYCNGPLKPNTVYVFKFRATNIMGHYTDSEYSEHIKTSVYGLLTRDEQIILGVLLSFFLAVLLIIIICCSVKLHQHKKEGGTYSPREAEIIETKCKLDQLIAIADMELKQEKINRLLSYRKSLKPVNKKSFLQHVEDLCSNDNAKFQEEFSALPKLLQDLATTDADMPYNRSKNRFPNIKPYNNNRVKLLSQPGSDGSDYINASFVSGYLCPNEFVATQGPLPGTVAAFWRMIWETSTRTIVMLTQCYEKGRIRCHKYWPEDDKPMSVFSDILISKVSEEIFPDWTVRTLRVDRHGHYILVRHFNYTSWPEHGVPESCSTLIKFVRTVRTHRLESSTIVVHCSAGVGRTGVYIALDHLIQHVRDHDFVDIYGLVAELRSERMCMVQNLAQYIFLHQSTLELLNNKGNSHSIWFVSYSALEKTDSLEGMEGDVELEWEETTM